MTTSCLFDDVGSPFEELGKALIHLLQIDQGAHKVRPVINNEKPRRGEAMGQVVKEILNPSELNFCIRSNWIVERRGNLTPWDAEAAENLFVDRVIGRVWNIYEPGSFGSQSLI